MSYKVLFLTIFLSMCIIKSGSDDEKFAKANCDFFLVFLNDADRQNILTEPTKEYDSISISLSENYFSLLNKVLEKHEIDSKSEIHQELVRYLIYYIAGQLKVAERLELANDCKFFLRQKQILLMYINNVFPCNNYLTIAWQCSEIDIPQLADIETNIHISKYRRKLNSLNLELYINREHIFFAFFILMTLYETVYKKVLIK